VFIILYLYQTTQLRCFLQTFPALFALYKQGFLPNNVHIVGYARSKIESQEYTKRITSYIKISDEEQEASKLNDFKNFSTYVAGGYEDDESFQNLNQHLEGIESKYQGPERHRLFYFALPPSVFIPVAQHLKRNCYSQNGVTRVIVEKPFGKDLDSARELIQAISEQFTESETFRIDHYLGKEMVKNLLVLRFANIAFSSAWDKNSISSVQITFKEPFGTEGRGGYFDEFGIIRDILQNRGCISLITLSAPAPRFRSTTKLTPFTSDLLQVLSILTMERPVSFSAEDIRDEKVKVLRAIPPIEREDVLLGQYVAANGKPGYLDDETVPPNSVCPTYAATTLWIHNPRWEGVPFILKAGKGTSIILSMITEYLIHPS